MLHLDTHLSVLASSHGVLVYTVLFLVIFVETGVIVMPFLPGDSLLFVAGALSAQGILQWPLVVPLLIAAAIAGDALNFAVGDILRRKAIDTRRIPLLKEEHLHRTNAFFEKHGKKTIVIARFVPIVRTLAPFVAALGNMPYRTFFAYNLIGAVAWVIGLVAAGYTFGNIAWVAKNLTAVLLGIIVLSLLPGIVAWCIERIQARSA